MTTPTEDRLAAVRGSSVAVPLQLVFAVNGALYGTILPRYPQLADGLGASEGEFGLALLGAGVGGILSSAAVTWVARRAGGPARAVAWAAPVMVLAVAAVGVAPTIPLLFAAILVLGLADGICDPSMNAVGAAEQERIGAVFMGRLHATWSAATLGATGIGAIVAGLGVGVVPHVLVATSVLLPVHVLASRRLVAVGGDLGASAFVDEHGPDAGGIGAHDPATAGTGRGPGPATSPRGRAARSPMLWAAMIVVGFSAIFIEIPPQEWSGLLLARELGAGPGLAGAAPFTFLGGVLAARIFLDRAVEHVGWRTVGIAGVAASVVGMAIGLGAGAASSSPWPVLAGLAVAGAGAAPQFPLLFDRATHIARRLGVAPDAGAGIIATATRSAMLVGPLVVGQIADAAGLFAGLAVVPVVGLVMLPALLLLLPRDGAG